MKPPETEEVLNRPNIDLVKTVAKFLKRALNLKTLSVVGLSLALADVRILSKGLILNKKAKLSQVTFLRIRSLGTPGEAERRTGGANGCAERSDDCTSRSSSGLALPVP